MLPTTPPTTTLSKFCPLHHPPPSRHPQSPPKLTHIRQQRLIQAIGFGFSCSNGGSCGSGKISCRFTKRCSNQWSLYASIHDSPPPAPTTGLDKLTVKQLRQLIKEVATSMSSPSTDIPKSNAKKGELVEWLMCNHSGSASSPPPLPSPPPGP